MTLKTCTMTKKTPMLNNVIQTKINCQKNTYELKNTGKVYQNEIDNLITERI